jgi:hypothetical protein
VLVSYSAHGILGLCHTVWHIIFYPIGVIMRRLQRNSQTMRTMLAQHAHEGRSPSVTAINTLYLSLLEGNAKPEQWTLFSKVASLPLTTTKFLPKCMTHGYYHPRKKEWVEQPCNNAPHCGHANVPVSTTIELEPLDQHRLNMGTVIGQQAAQSWWGKQLAEALGGAV